MTIDEQIAFCEEKSKNIKLRTEPQTFIDIKASLEELKTLRAEKEKIKLVFERDFCENVCPQRNDEYCSCHFAKLDYIEKVVENNEMETQNCKRSKWNYFK